MEIKNLVLQKPRFNALVKKLGGINPSKPLLLQLKGLTGSAAAVFLAPLKNTIQGQVFLCVLEDEERAGYFYHDVCQIAGDEAIAFFPSGYKRSIKYGQVDSANQILRTDTLARVSESQTLMIVTYPEALCEKVTDKTEVQESILTLHQGEKVNQKFVAEVLINQGFTRADYVYEPGQYAIRGSIVDVYSYSSELPYRIDFFGDEIDSLRTFEVDTQLSRESLHEITIAPSFEGDEQKGTSLLRFLPKETVVICHDVDIINDRVREICSLQISEQLMLSEEGDIKSLHQLISSNDFEADFNSFSKLIISNNTLAISKSALSVIEFHTTPQPAWNKNFDMIGRDISRYEADGYKIHILSDSDSQLNRIDAIFQDRGEKHKIIRVPMTIHEGFVDDDTRQCFFTDHQIFGRFHKYSLKSDRARSGKIALSIKELHDFNIGDYIVHVDFGIGRFGGLVEMPVGMPDPKSGKQRTQEVVKLVYQDGDLLFVSIHQLDKLSKYRGRDAAPPALSSLNSKQWEKMKERTKSKVKDIAKDLIALYALRKQETGFRFNPDSQMQHELEASFMFDETPDQLKAMNEVKRDMESARPMDRLICGDVGFGKTEVAIRAAMKACQDGKQVAVLVPTTVLAYQHFRTFSDRMKDFPVRVDYLSRARSTKQTKLILKQLQEGYIDILIGTHRVVSKDVKFKDLGLLIIDEEQKFGVKVKEQLRSVRLNVDTLTMTATPIPRTLQFSLMGSRDMSVISTPPPNRYPIQTEVHRDSDSVLKEAINFELSRNGQAFIINNKISQLPDIMARVERLVPDVRVVFGHGKMETENIEKMILDFANHEYDVLICTTIIEAGIDIPNANTMIVMNAQNYGLSELHQLRGRVGRTNKKAFCYLFTPPLATLSPDARRRIQAIENFSGLGSGIHLAMQDLDIRGAGNLLGGEQSGFINELGFETYNRILKQAVRELKMNEFKGFFVDTEQVQDTQNVTEECSVETDMDICFGESYVPESSERVALYKELDGLTTQTEIEDFRDRMKDRFGKIPQQGEELIRVVTLRQLAREVGFEKITIKQNVMRCNFVTGMDDTYFGSVHFERILDYLRHDYKHAKLAEKGGRRYLSFEPVRSIKEAIEYLKQIH